MRIRAKIHLHLIIYHALVHFSAFKVAGHLIAQKVNETEERCPRTSLRGQTADVSSSGWRSDLQL